MSARSPKSHGDGLVLVLCMCTATLLLLFQNPLRDAGAQYGKLNIYVVNYPLQYFAHRIAQDHADVRFPCPKDKDPAFWIPEVSSISMSI